MSGSSFVWTAQHRYEESVAASARSRYGVVEEERRLSRKDQPGGPGGLLGHDSRSRRLDLGQLELAVLREHRARQGERRRHWGDEWEGQDLLFCTDRGRPLGWRDTYRDFRNVLRKAGLEAIRFHDLRHTNATLLLEQGVHPKVVQERLGHSDIGVTLDTYSHVTPTMGRDAAQRLDDLLGEGGATGEEERGGERGEGSGG
jgi:integrase